MYIHICAYIYNIHNIHAYYAYIDASFTLWQCFTRINCEYDFICVRRKCGELLYARRLPLIKKNEKNENA